MRCMQTAGFRVTPNKARLQPLQSINVVVTFCPGQMGAYNSTMHLAVGDALAIVPIRAYGRCSTQGAKKTVTESAGDSEATAGKDRGIYGDVWYRCLHMAHFALRKYRMVDLYAFRRSIDWWTGGLASPAFHACGSTSLFCTCCCRVTQQQQLFFVPCNNINDAVSEGIAHSNAFDVSSTTWREQHRLFEPGVSVASTHSRSLDYLSCVMLPLL